MFLNCVPVGVTNWTEIQRKCLQSSLSSWSVCGSWPSSFHRCVCVYIYMELHVMCIVFYLCHSHHHLFYCIDFMIKVLSFFFLIRRLSSASGSCCRSTNTSTPVNMATSSATIRDRERSCSESNTHMFVLSRCSLVFLCQLGSSLCFMA